MHKQLEKITKIIKGEFTKAGLKTAVFTPTVTYIDENGVQLIDSVVVRIQIFNSLQIDTFIYKDESKKIQITIRHLQGVINTDDVITVANILNSCKVYLDDEIVNSYIG